MRSVPEWIGHTDDSAPPFHVRLRVFNRDYGRCQKCEHKLAGGERWQCDHIIALCNGGKNQESNLQVLCEPCHKKKTKLDRAEKDKVDRVRGKHFGIKKPRVIRAWRKFDGTKVFAGRER